MRSTQSPYGSTEPSSPQKLPLTVWVLAARLGKSAAPRDKTAAHGTV